MAQFVEATDMRRLAEHYGEQPTRKRLKDKNPAEYDNFIAQLSAMSAQRHHQHHARRAEAGGRRSMPTRTRIAAMATPALVVLGEEDEPCIKPSHFLKETLPGARLEMIRQDGARASISRRRTLVNGLVADFIDAVEARRAAR